LVGALTSAVAGTRIAQISSGLVAQRALAVVCVPGWKIARVRRAGSTTTTGITGTRHETGTGLGTAKAAHRFIRVRAARGVQLFNLARSFFAAG